MPWNHKRHVFLVSELHEKPYTLDKDRTTEKERLTRAVANTELCPVRLRNSSTLEVRLKIIYRISTPYKAAAKLKITEERIARTETPPPFMSFN